MTYRLPAMPNVRHTWIACLEYVAPNITAHLSGQTSHMTAAGMDIAWTWYVENADHDVSVWISERPIPVDCITDLTEITGTIARQCNSIGGSAYVNHVLRMSSDPGTLVVRLTKQMISTWTALIAYNSRRSIDPRTPTILAEAGWEQSSYWDKR